MIEKLFYFHMVLLIISALLYLYGKVKQDYFYVLLCKIIFIVSTYFLLSTSLYTIDKLYVNDSNHIERFFEKICCNNNGN